MKKPGMRLLLFAMALLLVIGGCKKETKSDYTDLMDGAMEYTGSYPPPAAVTYSENEGIKTIHAYPGQSIVYFQAGVSESDAVSILTSNGATVLAQIPAIGYYFVSVTGQVGSFITSVQSNKKTEMALPHIAGTLSAAATILDNCDGQHGSRVQANLEHCGGTLEKCVNILGADVYVLWNKIVQGITAEANSTKAGPVLINISASGFNHYSNRKWTQLTPDEKAMARTSWIVFIKGLFAIYNFPESVRKNVILTISSGNGDMPITDLMADLKQNAKMAELLSNNVLVVSNSHTSTGKGNYSETDPDVVVVDNTSTPDAPSGTSYSAPCALGLIQRLIDEKGVSPSEALQIVKTASQLNANRVVSWNSMVGLVGMEHFVSGPCRLVGYPIIGDCGWKFQYDFESTTINWNGSAGNMSMPTALVVSLQSGVNCDDDGTLREAVMSGSLTGTNSGITGTVTGNFPTNSGTVPLSLTFTGQKSGNQITGTLQSSGNISFAETMQISLNKQ